MFVQSGKQENLITSRPSQLVKQLHIQLNILIYFLIIIIEINSGKELLPVHCTR